MVNMEGKWIESETIRIGFASLALPQYITVYNCRFTVLPFVFPVTQCSGCWQFGHTKLRCPRKKILCPKCGDKHANCETLTFTCVNCKGPHMALDKECPMFVKEKKIRCIMSEKNITYCKALQRLLCNESNEMEYIRLPAISEQDNTSSNVSQNPSKATSNSEASKTYSEVVSSSKKNLSKNVSFKAKAVTENINKRNKNDVKTKPQHMKKKNETREFSSDGEDQSMELETENSNAKEDKEMPDKKNKQDIKYKLDFRRFFGKLMSILLSCATIEQKITDVMGVCFEEIKLFVRSLLTEEEIFGNIGTSND